MELSPAVLIAALKRYDGIISDVARALGVSRQGIYYAMRRHGIPRLRNPHAYSRRMSENGKRGGRPRTEAA